MEIAKREIAVINLQVMNELCHAVLRKLPYIPPADLQLWIDELRVWGDTVVDDEAMTAAWLIRAAFGFSWFDCILLSAAERLGCTHFLSEDMGHGTVVGDLTIVNPFRVEPDKILPPSGR